MLDDLASGNWRTASYTHAGRTRTYTSIKDFMEALELVRAKMLEESGTFARRTYARPVPRSGS